MASVYIETTVPSAYVTARSDPGSVYRKNVTREWWEQQLGRYDAWTSDSVILELKQGEWPGQDDSLVLVEPLRRLATTDEILGVAQRYVRERLVPQGLTGDAIHLAAACVCEMDFLLTWNIRHLANPNKTRHLTEINRRLGLLTPQIVTPETLWSEDEP